MKRGGSRSAVRALFNILGQKWWLIPTAEVPLTNLVREDITDEAKLPIRVTAHALLPRRGRRRRQRHPRHDPPASFSKVELVSITTPEQSEDEHECMTTCAEDVLKRLDIPYRVIVLSTGDMGFASQKTYDLEVWLPGQGSIARFPPVPIAATFRPAA